VRAVTTAGRSRGPGDFTLQQRPGSNPASGRLTSGQFRSLFPALSKQVWLDTPAAPPAATPVSEAVKAAVDEWTSGDFAWTDWVDAGEQARVIFARLLGVSPATVALLASTGEAAATVAKDLPAGDIVIGDLEYRSLLFPFTGAEDGEHRLIRATSGAPGVRTSDLIAAMTKRTRIVVVSDVLSQDGHRLDLEKLREATDAVGAQLFVDATQSLGALRFDYDRIRPDYLVVHGYKWLLSPRGAAFLVVRDSLVREMRPLQPNVQSSVDGMYFGGTLSLWPTAARLDTSPAWLSWVGARSALALLSTLDARHVEEHCLDLANQFREAARDLGYQVLDPHGSSQIVTVEVPNPGKLTESLRDHRIRCLTSDERMRVGFHYFNNSSDLQAVVAALREGR
jgi:selenocysteine lyase/cysteine desulfurase